MGGDSLLLGKKRAKDMYSFKSRIRYSETDSEGYLSIGSMINYFQDCSTFQSEDLNVGIQYLKKRNLGWMIIAWKVRIQKRPMLGEEITIGTWPHAFKNIKGGRGYVMLDNDGKVLVEADSQWVLYDMEKKSIIRIPEEISSAYTLKPSPDLGGFEKIRYNEEGLKLSDTVKVSSSFLDTNGHVNNGKYVSMAENCLKGNEYDGFCVEYRNQAFLNDEISIYGEKAGERKLFVMKNQDNQVLANVEFYKNREEETFL